MSHAGRMTGRGASQQSTARGATSLTTTAASASTEETRLRERLVSEIATVVGPRRRLAPAPDDALDDVSTWTPSRDGRTLVIGTRHGSVRYVDIEKHRTTTLLSRPDDGVTVIQLFDEDRVAAVGFSSGVTGLWSFPEGRLERLFEYAGIGGVNSVAILGQALIVGSGKAYLFHRATGRMIRRYTELQQSYEILIPPDADNRYFIAREWQEARVVNVWSGRTTRRLRENTGHLISLALLAGGPLLLATYSNGSIHEIDWRTGERRRSWTISPESAVAVRRAGTAAAPVLLQGSGKKVAQLDPATMAPGPAVEFPAAVGLDPRRLFVADPADDMLSQQADAVIRRHSMTSGKLHDVHVLARETLVGVCLAADGNSLATASVHSAKRFDLTLGTRVARVEAQTSLGLLGGFGAEDTARAVFVDGASLSRFDLIGGHRTSVKIGVDGYVSGASMSADLSRVLILGATEVALHHSSDERPIGRIPIAEIASGSVHISPAGDIGAVGCISGVVHVLDVASEEVIAVLDTRLGPSTRVHLAHEGTRLIVRSADGTLSLWEWRTGTLLETLPPPAPGSAAPISWQSGGVLTTRDPLTPVMTWGARLILLPAVSITGGIVAAAPAADLLAIQTSSGVLSFYSISDRRHLGEMHHFAAGALWIAAPQADGSDVTFFTDRPELVTAIELSEDGSRRPAAPHAARVYLATCNDAVRTMAAIRGKPLPRLIGPGSRHLPQLPGPAGGPTGP